MKHKIILASTLAVFWTADLVEAQGAAQWFEPSPYIFVDHWRRMEYPADLDGDGDMEIVGWWSYYSDHESISVLFWDQDENSGTWSELEETFHADTGNYRPGTATGIGDFDADGRDEMAVVHQRGIDVFQPDRNGLPEQTESLLFDPFVSNPERDCAVHDFNNDGRDDLLVTTDEVIRYYRASASGFVLEDTRTMNGGSLSVVLADVEGDGAKEVAVLQNLPVPRIRVYALNGTQLQSPMTYFLEPGAGGSPSDLVKLADGDVDGDGDTDLVVFGMGGFYQVLRRDAAGLAIEAPKVGGPATDLVDFDRDGDLDGICCGSGGGSDPVANSAPSTFHLTMNDGTGVFDVSVPFEGLGAEHVAGVLDFDNDGDLDVLGGRAVLLNYETLGVSVCDGEPNSAGAGAVLSASGRHSVGEGGPAITVQGLPSSTIGILLASPLDFADDLHFMPYLDGVFCTRPPFKRLRIVQANQDGVANCGTAADWNTGPGTIHTSMGVAGDAQYAYQLWYRDSAPGQQGANLSSAVRVHIVE